MAPDLSGRVICYLSDEGQLAHKIYRFLALVQFALETGADVCYPSFYAYLGLFGPLDDRPCLAFSSINLGLGSAHLNQMYSAFLMDDEVADMKDALSKTESSILRAGGRLPSSGPLSMKLYYLTASLMKTLLNSPGALNAISVISKDQQIDLDACRDLASKEFKDRIGENKLVFVDIDDVYCSNSCRPRALEICKGIFKPFGEYYDRQQMFKDIFIRDADIWIGVHIRQGDYREWNDGSCFFTATQYYDAMSITKEYFPGKKVKFLVASNERRTLDEFPGLDVVLAPVHFLDDLYLLSDCDYLIGTGSGYVDWASEYGNRPLFKLSTEKLVPSALEDFVVANL